MKTLNLILTVAILSISIQSFAGTTSKMAGTYTIGHSDSSDFKTISAAINALDNHGASGPVTFVIEKDGYNQAEIILALQKVSAMGNVAFISSDENNNTADASTDTVKF